MKKNLKLIVFLVIGIIALYISTNYYNDFNRIKTIKACIIGKRLITKLNVLQKSTK